MVLNQPFLGMGDDLMNQVGVLVFLVCAIVRATWNMVLENKVKAADFGITDGSFDGKERRG
jgi:hypothetical protein